MHWEGQGIDIPNPDRLIRSGGGATTKPPWLMNRWLTWEGRVPGHWRVPAAPDSHCRIRSYRLAWRQVCGVVETGGGGDGLLTDDWRRRRRRAWTRLGESEASHVLAL